MRPARARSKLSKVAFLTRQFQIAFITKPLAHQLADRSMTAAKMMPPEMIFEEGTALLRNGNIVAAEQRFEALLLREPRHAAALHVLGIIRVRQGKHREAISLLTKATEIDPTSAEIHNNLVLALHAC